MNPFFEILLLLAVLVFCTPILTKSNIILMVVLVLWGYMITNGWTNRIKSSLYIPVILYIILIFAYRFLGISDAAWGNYLNQLGFLSCILFMPFIRKSERPREWLLWTIWAIIVFNVVDNIFLSNLYPQINSGRFYLDEEFLSSINGGGPSFYFLTLFVFNICFFVLLNNNQGLLRIPILICCVVTLVYILGFCYKGITVLFLLLSVFVIYSAKHSKKTSSFVVLCGSTFVIIFSALFLFSDFIIEYIKDVSPDERLTVRLVTLIDYSDIEADTFTVTGRTDLYLISIKTWLLGIGNFLLGIGDHRVQVGAAKTGISQHSDLLDILPIYGLVGLILIFLIFKRAFKIILSYFDSDYKLQVSSILMLFVLYGFIEKIFNTPTGLVIFLLLPLSSVLVNKKQNR